MCMAPPPTEKIPGLEVKMKPQACPGKVWRASLGDVGRPTCLRADLYRNLWGALADRVPTGRSKRHIGAGQRGAKYVTHSAISRA